MKPLKRASIVLYFVWLGLIALSIFFTAQHFSEQSPGYLMRNPQDAWVPFFLYAVGWTARFITTGKKKII